MDLEQKKRELARWLILRAADAGRPVGVGESILRSILKDGGLALSAEAIRRELDYLRDCGLLALFADAEEWQVRPTPAGTNVVEYTIPAPAGVARPERR